MSQHPSSTIDMHIDSFNYYDNDGMHVTSIHVQYKYLDDAHMQSIMKTRDLLWQINIDSILVRNE